MKKILKEYWIELATLLVLNVGILLVAVKVNIFELLARWLVLAGTSLLDAVSNLVYSVVASLESYTLTDFLGWTIILLGNVLVFWRARCRLLKSEHWLADACPRCGGQIHRVHRTNLDYLLTRTILPDSRRYSCSDLNCGWKGLRQPSSRAALSMSKSLS